MGKWSCPICNKTLSSPVIAGCGHTFCWRCLCKHMEHQNNCPVCKQYLDYSTFTAIKGIGKEDQDLESLPPLPQSHNDDFSYTSKPPRVNPNPEPDLNAGNNFGNPTNRQEFTTPEGNTIIHEEYNNPDGSITIREETITPDGQRTVHQEITNPYGGRTFQRQFGTPQRDFQPRTARTEFNGYPCLLYTSPSPRD